MFISASLNDLMFSIKNKLIDRHHQRPERITPRDPGAIQCIAHAS